ncbi:MAG: NUDIX hydrolase, partial [Magnetococcales bacterium]|nr:NUDIX hydrolase [Magnetococcales bacterium]
KGVGAGWRCRSALPPGETVHENPWFVVRDRGGYYTTEPREPQLVVLPIVEGERVVLIRAIRPVIDDATLELPAGGFHPERESGPQGAARELAEETGIVIGDWSRFQPLPSLSVSPNRCPDRIQVYRIDLTGEEFAGRGAHDHEVVEVLCLSWGELLERIVDGRMYVTMPIAVILRHGVQSGTLTLPEARRSGGAA